MGLNPRPPTACRPAPTPSSARGRANPVACPAASKIGTVSIETPPLPDGSLTGNVYVGQQLSRDPTSGKEYRIFVDAESARYGISVRLVGNVSADPPDRAADDDLRRQPPQVPFSSFRLDFDGGPKAPLTSPPTCGPNTTTTPDDAVVAATPAGDARQASFTLTTAPGGGACAKTLADAPLRAELRRRDRPSPKAAPTARSTSTSPAPTATRS